MVAFRKAVCVKKKEKYGSSLLAAGVLGDRLGALRHGVLGELSRQKETDSGLDFPAGDGVLLVVVGQAGSLVRHALKDVVDEGVHDAHGLAGDSSLGVDLLQDLVDVDRVALLAGLSLLLGLSTASGLGLCGGFLFALLGSNFSSRHFVELLALRFRLENNGNSPRRRNRFYSRPCGITCKDHFVIDQSDCTLRNGCNGRYRCARNLI